MPTQMTKTSLRRTSAVPVAMLHDGVLTDTPHGQDTLSPYATAKACGVLYKTGRARMIALFQSCEQSALCIRSV